MIEEKKCGRCKDTKAVQNFHRVHTMKDGYAAWCKTCASVYRKQKRSKKERVKPEFVFLESRPCKKCGVVRGIEQFPKDHRRPDGRAVTCKVCKAERDKKYQEENKEWCKKKSSDWYANNKERAKSTNRKNRLSSTFGISSEEYDRMLVEQNGVCAICGLPQKIKGVLLDVDHCHTTGRVRGLLCRLCNQAIGMLGDDPQRLLVAANYLIERGNAPHG